MFKNKGFLYGLGLGLILGASLLYLMNVALIKTNNLAGEAPVASATPQATSTLKPTPKTTPFKTIAPAATVASVATAEPAKVIKPSTPVKPTLLKDNSDLIEVIIVEGMISADVAKLLYDKGIIMDQVGFEKSLDKLKLDRVIHYGSYQFTANQNLDEVINKITTLK